MRSPRPGEFVAAVGRDWLTEKAIAGLGLHPRQQKAVLLTKAEGKISNAGYQRITGASRLTAIRALAGLVTGEARGTARDAH